MSAPMRPRRLGFTLIELLVVIAIIGILIGMLLPAVQKVRNSAARTQGQNNMRQMALAAQMYANARGGLPPTIGWDNRDDKPTEGGANGTAHFHLLPFVEQQPLYDSSQSRLSGFIYTGSSYVSVTRGVRAFRAQRASRAVPVYVAPNDPTAHAGSSHTSYFVNKEVFDHRLPVGRISDGTSNTILVAEGYASCYGGSNRYRWSTWALGTEAVNINTGNADELSFPYPSQYYWPSSVSSYTRYVPPAVGVVTSYNRPDTSVWNGSAWTVTPGAVVTDPTFQVLPRLYQDCASVLPQGLSPAGLQVAMADGSVRTIAGTVEVPTWRGLLTPDGGEVLGEY